MSLGKEIVMKRLLLSFRRIFNEELLKIQNADEIKSKLIESEKVKSILDESSAVTSAKSYVNNNKPKRA